MFIGVYTRIYYNPKIPNRVAEIKQSHKNTYKPHCYCIFSIEFRNFVCKTCIRTGDEHNVNTAPV